MRGHGQGLKWRQETQEQSFFELNIFASNIHVAEHKPLKKMI
jgi:hypothetical protein